METYKVSLTLLSFTGFRYLRELFSRLLWGIPADVDYLVKLIQAIDGHRHVIVRGHNLSTSAHALPDLVRVMRTSWKSSLNRFLSNCEYFSNIDSNKSLNGAVE